MTKAKIWVKGWMVALLATAGFITATAQEFPVYNQYYFNYYLINPAVAGASNCHHFMLTHKQQWMGIDDAPHTTMFSYQGRWPRNVGLGAYVYHDVNGYSTQQAGQLTFAYHIPLTTGRRAMKAENSDRQLSFGISAKVFNYGYRNEDELKKESTYANDVAMQNLDNLLNFNVNLGVYYVSYGFFAGLTGTNLLGTKMNETVGSVEPLIPPSIYGLVGYEWDVTKFDAVEPSAVVMYDTNGNSTIDANLKYTRTSSAYRSDWSWWVAGTLRQNVDEGDYQGMTLIPMGGIQYHKFHCALAYGIDLTRLYRHNYGTLELMLGYTFCYTRRFCR